MRPRLWLSVPLLSLLAALPTAACPLCASPTGNQVRAGITNDFGYHLAAIGLPFVVFLLIVYVVQFGLPLRLPLRSALTESQE